MGCPEKEYPEKYHTVSMNMSYRTRERAIKIKFKNANIVHKRSEYAKEPELHLLQFFFVSSSSNLQMFLSALPIREFKELKTETE